MPRARPREAQGCLVSVYFVRVGARGPIKIGKATNPRARLSELQVGHYKTLCLLAYSDQLDEAKMHRRFKHLRLRGEWFRAAPELRAFVKTMPHVGLTVAPRGRPVDEREKKLVRFSPDLYRRLERVAAENQRDVNSEITYGLAQYLDALQPLKLVREKP